MRGTYDFIVVGGGSAGCVAAAALARDGQHSVALIEQGPRDRSPWIHIPATLFLTHGPKTAYAVASDPDASLDGRSFHVPQGRVVGGGSSVNGMIYMRGQAQDYDDWEQVFGCTGWSYADVLPVFRAQENNQRLGGEFHGQSGPLVVDDPAYRHPLTQRILHAAHQVGLPMTDDFNGAQQDGAGWYQITASRGRRKSAAVSFLNPVLGQPNLDVLTGAQVSHIVIENRRATGVAFADETGQRVVHANREVMITAGSFQSPKLLMLSGIGPRDMLTRNGIDVIADSPEVGANLQDHVGTPVTARMSQPIALYRENAGLKAVRHGLEYLFLRRGLLTSNLLEAGACIDTTGSGRPDVQFNFNPFAPGPPGTPPLDEHACSVVPMTMRPASRGRVVLASANPSDSPRVLSSVLGHEDDMDTLRRGVRIARDILDQADLNAVIAEEIWPGSGVSSAIGSNNLDDAIRAQARTIFHPSGTCRMGPDDNAVVDDRLQVRGVDGLRVCDCSIMPALVSGNTNAPTMMIAERAARWALDHA
ncbi:MAG: GMC family oxidoreductase [Paracoccaceae bacterium]